MILDIAMPGEDGSSVARWLRSRGPRPGIILATSAGASIDKIVGLEIGADDYVVKPFDLREMLARVRSVLRRLPPESDGPAPEPAAPQRVARTVRIGNHVLNLDSRTLFDSAGAPAGSDLDGDRSAGGAGGASAPRSHARTTARTRARARAERERPQHRHPRDPPAQENRSRTPSTRALIRTVRGEGYMFVPAEG